MWADDGALSPIVSTAVSASINYRKRFLPDGAATSDMCHHYQSERTLGFNIKVSLLRRLSGNPASLR
jgi:hypothetical protein